ncbi:Peptidase S1, PA clan,Serine proteases, trypsin domain, partial [Cinara cedri]
SCSFKRVVAFYTINVKFNSILFGTKKYRFNADREGTRDVPDIDKDKSDDEHYTTIPISSLGENVISITTEEEFIKRASDTHYFPYHVLIAKSIDEQDLWCQGVLIKSNWILTSRTCIKKHFSIRSKEFVNVYLDANHHTNSKGIFYSHVTFRYRINVGMIVSEPGPDGLNDLQLSKAKEFIKRASDTHSFPYHVVIAVSIDEQGKWCQGVLIKSNWILTSRTCIKKHFDIESKTPMQVFLDAINHTNSEGILYSNVVFRNRIDVGMIMWEQGPEGVDDLLLFKLITTPETRKISAVVLKLPENDIVENVNCFVVTRCSDGVVRGLLYKLTGQEFKLDFELLKPGSIVVCDNQLLTIKTNDTSFCPLFYTQKIIEKQLPETLAQLRIDNYYLMDFDITQDFVGVYNKTEMTRFLTNNHNFFTRGEYDDGSNIIVDNNKTVFIDSLTWLNSNAIVKTYNKFVCQITSPGVNKLIGNHIIDFINCPNASLKEIFSSNPAREYGITQNCCYFVFNYFLQQFPLMKTISVCQRKNTSKKWLILDTDGFYRIAAFTVNNKGKYPNVGEFAEKGETKLHAS